MPGVGCRVDNAFAPPVMQAPHLVRLAQRHGLEVLPAGFENSVVAPEPQPAAAVGDDLRDRVVVESLPRRDPAEAPVAPPTEAVVRVTNPHPAVARGLPAADS